MVDAGDVGVVDFGRDTGGLGMLKKFDNGLWLETEKISAVKVEWWEFATEYSVLVYAGHFQHAVKTYGNRDMKADADAYAEKLARELNNVQEIS